MKNLFTLLLITTLFVSSCSKDNDTAPSSSKFNGTWIATSESAVYLNLDGTSFRDDFITEDDVDTDPDYEVVITDDRKQRRKNR